MRMKFTKSSQLVLVSAASLLAATLVTACSQFTQTLTIDFVYVASSRAAGPNQYGEINVFEINSESGHMRQIPSSPFPSAGRNPVAEAPSADYSSLFVANHDDNSIVQFVIGTDGKLYPFSTVNTPGIYPLGLAVSKANLFIIDTYQPLPICSTAAPCSGSVAVYPLNAASGNNPITMGSPAANGGQNYWALCASGYKQSGSTWMCSNPAAESDVIVPSAVNVLANGSNVYVSAYDSTVTPNTGYIFGFSVGAGGALTPIAGSPFRAGTQPSGIASSSDNSYLYVTDALGNSVLGFTVGGSGALTPMTSGVGGTNAFAAGNKPSAIIVNPTYPFAYVTNLLDGTLTAYKMSNGALTKIADYPTGSQPVAVGVDPSTNRFLFTANFLDNNVSGFQLDKGAGTLLISQFSPFPSSANPTAVAAVPHNGTGGGIQP